MKKPKVYKIEAYQFDKGWSITVTMFREGEKKYCFTTTKQMINFLIKINK